MDPSVSPTHGEQEGAAYNGHFSGTCYHPLFMFNQFGDLERCALRPGNLPSAEGWRAVLEPHRATIAHSAAPRQTASSKIKAAMNATAARTPLTVPCANEEIRVMKKTRACWR